MEQLVVNYRVVQDIQVNTMEVAEAVQVIMAAEEALAVEDIILVVAEEDLGA
jgi:hypothetical protein